MTLEPGIYYTPRYDGMIVMVDESGFPRPVSTDYSTLVTHKSEPARLLEIWGPLTRAKVVPEEKEKDVEPDTTETADSAETAEEVDETETDTKEHPGPRLRAITEPAPEDPREARMDLKAKALKMAREALRSTAMFGTHQTFDPIDLMTVADWLLDEAGHEEAPAPITAEMLQSVPDKTVVLDAEGLAYQWVAEESCWFRAVDGWVATTTDLVEDYGVVTMYLPGDSSGG